MMKKCSKCGQEKPATAEFFHSNKRGKYGVMAVCRECRNKKPIPPPPQPEDYERFRLQPNSEMKRCPQCEEWKPSTPEYFFRGDNKTKSGLDGWCKLCRVKKRNKSTPSYIRQLKKNATRAAEIKKLLLEQFGGKCITCGYYRCPAALDFHHIVPEEKEFPLARAHVLRKSWDEILKEAKKCSLLCANCHREIEHIKRRGHNESEEFAEVDRDSETTLPDLLCEESEVSDVSLCLSMEEESSDFNWAEQS
jgi:hypothetical protein